MMIPTDAQQAFIESNAPALTWETPVRGSGGTTALVFAAMRDMQQNGYRALLLKAHALLWPILVEDIQRLAPQHGLREVQRREWVVPEKGSMLSMSAAYSMTFMDYMRFDFIGIDDVEYLGQPKLEEISKYVRNGGRLRCVRNTKRLNELLGQRFDGHTANLAAGVARIAKGRG